MRNIQLKIILENTTRITKIQFLLLFWNEHCIHICIHITFHQIHHLSKSYCKIRWQLDRNYFKTHALPLFFMSLKISILAKTIDFYTLEICMIFWHKKSNNFSNSFSCIGWFMKILKSIWQSANKLIFY